MPYSLQPYRTLTAAEFIKAFDEHTPLSPSAENGQLNALEKSIIRCLPNFAGFVRLVAEHELKGSTLKESFVALAEAAQRLAEIERSLSRQLFKARLESGLPPRGYDADLPGATATSTLVNVAGSIVRAVYTTVDTYEGAGCSEDDDPILEGPTLTFGSTAEALQVLFSGFKFPDPGPLLHEMQVELMALDRSFSPTLKTENGGDVYGPPVPPQDYNPSLLMPQAAQDSKKGSSNGGAKRKAKDHAAAKDELKSEPLPLPQSAYPVEVTNFHILAGMIGERHSSGQVEGNGVLKPARHGPGFRSVHWYGTDYRFSEMQAAVIEALWKAWENGTPSIAGDLLLGTAKSENYRLVDLFKTNGQKHPAFGTMIQAGLGAGSKGTFRLCPPK